ncbi:hypothetical protein HPULCUR_012046 [Helicostylum pulchrum]|uniref:Cas12f1-like TNB domain-containing protein n=1 Tax=Helicostylum pulchrum TaxID=562976 RepID=A0ABP9YI37_9FUNG
MKGKDSVRIKTHEVGITNTLYKVLKKKDFLYLKLTSKVCNAYQQEALAFAYQGLVSDLACQNCGMMWNRDFNAAENINDISRNILRGDGPLPAFCRSNTN